MGRGKEGVILTVEARMGDPKQEILKLAEEMQVDQIFMGSRGLGVIAKYAFSRIFNNKFDQRRFSILQFQKFGSFSPAISSQSIDIPSDLFSSSLQVVSRIGL